MSEPVAPVPARPRTAASRRPSRDVKDALDRHNRRIDWMDLLRGLAILLVVLHHSTQIVSARIDELPEAFTFVSDFFAPFRMPMLMFLSGLLVAGSLKRPVGPYVWGKVRRIVWPIIVWTVIYVTASGGSDYAWYEPAFWATYLWFLQFITAYYLIALLTKWVPTWVFVVLPFAGAFLLPMDSLEQRFLYLMPFFFLGALIERFWTQYASILSTRWAVILSVIPLAIALYSGLVYPLWYHPLAALPAMVGILVLVRLASIVPEVRWLAPVRFTGRYSLIFYCVHYPVFAALGRLAERAGITDPVVGLLGVFALTLLVCFGFAYIGRRLPVSLLFELPTRRKAKAPARR